jgi:hypothetical protein
VCHFPNSQSKSCCPSRTDAGRAVDDAGGVIEDAGRAVSAAAEFSCASAATALTISDKPKNPRIIDETITRFAADIRLRRTATVALIFPVSEEAPKAFGDDLGDCGRHHLAVLPLRSQSENHGPALASVCAKAGNIRGRFSKKNQGFDNFDSLFP